jgi:hypoxanthine-guanine phosphoribosyltransferase
MKKKTNTSEKILDFIKDKNQATGHELAGVFHITTRAIRKQLSNLLKEQRIYKVGRPPKVFYLLKDQIIDVDEYEYIDSKIRKIIDKNFLNITPSGEKQEGFEGFINWCNKRNDPVEKTAKEYVTTIKKYDVYKKDNLIDGMYKMKKTFQKDMAVDKLFYLDFYSIERFGKTKLGQLLLYAKQSQSKSLIKELILQIKPQIESVIRKHKIDAVGFIPPTVKREVQLMKEIEKQLDLPIAIIPITKIKTPVIVPQKTLNKLEDRIENAKKTIFIEGSKSFKKVLLIDDALGSGATLNETAKKLKSQKIAATVIGLAITGRFSGFEVISEV